MADIASLKKLVNNFSYKISEEEVDEFFSYLKEVHYKRNTSIVAAGEMNDNLYIVKDGIIRSFYTKENKEITLYFGMDGDFFFSANSFYGGLPSLITIESCGDTELMMISKQDFMNLCYHSVGFANWALDNALGQLWSLEVKSTLIAGDAYDRYYSLVKKRPEILQKVPLKTIASYLGITKHSLSRLRNPKYRNDADSSSAKN